MPITVWGLSLGQALLTTGNILLVAICALIGKQLAPSESMWTLPVALQFFGQMCVILPAAHLMRRLGRRTVFLMGNSVGVSGATFAYFALYHENFTWFCIAMFLMGMAIGVGQQYRFAAVEHAKDGQQARAVSLVMGGGVLAAILGPNLAIWVKSDVPHQQYLNVFLVLISVYVVALVLVWLLPLKKPTLAEQTGEVRSYSDLFKQPLLSAAIVSGTIGYAVMVLVMTATPLAMAACGQPFSNSAYVIQWHVLGMFVPSFVTGRLITRFGVRNIMFTGCAMLLACVLTNQLGNSYGHFAVALVLLGVGWNFTFIGATTLLTQTYRPAEKAKVQGINDFLVFSSAAIASLFSGYLQSHLGWERLNLMMLPFIVVAAGLVAYGFRVSAGQINALKTR